LAKATVYGLVHPISQETKLYFLLDWVISGKQNSKSEIEIKANEYLSKTDCINRQSNVKITKMENHLYMSVLQ
jgi:hypothetical protein